MKDNFRDVFFEMTFGECRDKVKEEKLKDYLKNYDEEMLRWLVLNSFDMSSDVRKFVTMKKSQLIKFICSETDKVVWSFLALLVWDDLDDLRKVIDMEFKEYSAEELPVPFGFIFTLYNYGLVNVEFNPENKKIKVFMPLELKESSLRALEDDEFKERNRVNCSVWEYLCKVLNVYGYLTLEECFEDYSSDVEKISELEFKSVVMNLICFHSKICLEYSEEVDDDVLFDETFDDIYDVEMYMKDVKSERKKYSVKELDRIWNNEYLHELDAYKELVKYLRDTYKVNDGEIEVLDEYITKCYLMNTMFNFEYANELVDEGTFEFLEIEVDNLDVIIKYLSRIYEEYPKWNKRGNV